jgi:hypothetical protein
VEAAGQCTTVSWVPPLWCSEGPFTIDSQGTSASSAQLSEIEAYTGPKTPLYSQLNDPTYILRYQLKTIVLLEKVTILTREVVASYMISALGTEMAGQTIVRGRAVRQ